MVTRLPRTEDGTGEYVRKARQVRTGATHATIGRRAMPWWTTCAATARYLRERHQQVRIYHAYKESVSYLLGVNERVGRHACGACCAALLDGWAENMARISGRGIAVFHTSAVNAER